MESPRPPAEAAEGGEAVAPVAVTAVAAEVITPVESHQPPAEAAEGGEAASRSTWGAKKNAGSMEDEALAAESAVTRNRTNGVTGVTVDDVAVDEEALAQPSQSLDIWIAGCESEESRLTLGSTLNDSLDVVTTPARYNRNSSNSTPEAASTAVMLPVFAGNGDGETPVSSKNKNRNDSWGSVRSPSTTSTVTHTTPPGDRKTKSVVLDGGDVGGGVSRQNDRKAKTHDSEAVLRQ